MHWRYIAALAFVASRALAQDLAGDSGVACWVYHTPDATFRVEVVARGLTVPVGLSFLSNDRAIVVERPTGVMSILDLRSGVRTRIEGVPAVVGTVDGGLLDVVLHPDFAHNHRIYFTYAEPTDSGNATVVDQAVLDGTRLVDRTRIFSAAPYIDNDNEFGARLVIDRGFLYVAVGQRDVPQLSQDLGSTGGKIIRLSLDGSVPDDNPFVHRAGARPEIWSYGHRNPQGLAINPATGTLWEHEHGPRGGDEINIIRRGRNYGWPVISYGIEYTGELVGHGLTHHAGMEQPLYYYVPSIAPSGMAFYTGRDFPRWRGSLFLGSMSYRHLNRVVLAGDRVVREERLLRDRRWRIREVRQSPDGTLYLGVESGLIVRIRPSGAAAAADSCVRGLTAEDGWQATDSTRDTPVGNHAAGAYDAAAKSLVRYGGTIERGSMLALDSTWEWNGQVWAPIAVADRPHTSGAAASTDPDGVLLFGGDSAGLSQGTTWQYHEHAWTKTVGPGPRGRSGASLAYDADHQLAVLFGGRTTRSNGRSFPQDTWHWNGRQWTLTAMSGPPPREGAAMAYDYTTRTVLLFGGRDTAGVLLRDIWRWDGTGWASVKPLAPKTSGPSARESATLVYSATRNRMLLIGGTDGSGRLARDVWELDDTWRRVDSLTLPDLRYAWVAVDIAHDRIVLTGQRSSDGVTRTFVALR